MRLLRGLVGLALIAGVGAIAFTSFANWRKDGAFSLRVFDGAWWRVGHDEAQPYVDQAEEKAKAAYSAVWDQGGLVDQASDWVKEMRARRADPAKDPKTPADAKAPEQLAAPTDAPKTGLAPVPAPTAPAKPPKSKATQQIEQRIDAAEDIFEKGVAHYQAGNPTQGGFTDAKKKELSAAKDCFKQVRDILDQQLDQYEALPDHDGQRAADARRMQHYNQQLLFNAGKMGGGI